MGWSNTPEDILAEVFLYLSLPDRYHTSLVCRTWANVFQSPYVWTHCELRFSAPHHSQLIELVRHHGRYIRTTSILVDPSEEINRENACAALLELARQKGRRLQRLKIRFIEQNPCLYNGQEFLDCLYALFGPPFTSNNSDEFKRTEGVENGADEPKRIEGIENVDEGPNRTEGFDNSEDEPSSSKRVKSDLTVENVGATGAETNQQECDDIADDTCGEMSDDRDNSSSQLKHIDLSGLRVNLDGRLLDILSANNPDLESLDIQNKVLICKVYPGHMQQFVERCRKLKSLKIYSCSNSEELLLSLIQEKRSKLEHLSIIHRREDKVIKNISHEVWAAVIKKLPNLRVTLGFDSTCPLFKLSEVMQPEIPVTVLRLETYTDLATEIRLAASYYSDTLEKLIVNSPPTRHSRELDDAIIELSRTCHKLSSLHVFCVLAKETVDLILEKFPLMKARGAYTLKYVAEEHPWQPGNDFWP